MKALAGWVVLLTAIVMLGSAIYQTGYQRGYVRGADDAIQAIAESSTARLRWIPSPYDSAYIVTPAGLNSDRPARTEKEIQEAVEIVRGWRGGGIVWINGVHDITETEPVRVIDNRGLRRVDLDGPAAQ